MQGIHPRTFRMLHERSTIWAKYPQFLNHKTLNFSSSIIVKMKKHATQHVMNKGKLKVKNIFSEHFTIWATSPQFLCYKTLNISSSIIVNMKNLKRNNIFSNRFIWRSKVSIPYFSHGKPYHLSYIPTIHTSENPKCPVINICENEKNISTHYVINKERLSRNKILITISISIPLAC